MALLVLMPFISAITPVTADHTNSNLIDDQLFVDTDSMSSGEISNWLSQNAGFLKGWSDSVHLNFPNKTQQGNPDPDVRDFPCRTHIGTGKSAAQIIAEAAINWQAQFVVWRDTNDQIIQPSDWASTPSSQIKSCRTETDNWPAYGLKTISPKVILATLEKEQSLVSAGGSYSISSTSYNSPPCDVDPGSPYYGQGGCKNNNYKLAWAMGYGVPDSGGKNHRFKGFYHQVNWAAWQFRFNFERSAAVANSNCGLTDEDPTQSGICWDDVEGITYGGPMTNGTFVRCGGCSSQAFNGNATVDGQTVFISNRATASLYYYTPHLGQSFPGIYEDFFNESVHIPTYKARLVGRSNAFGIKPGLSKEVFLAYRNIGSATWYDSTSHPPGVSPTVLAATNSLYRHSVFNGMFERDDRPVVTYTTVYESNGSTLSGDQDRVEPNQIIKFEFDFVAPMDIDGSRTYNEWFEPVKQPNSVMGGDARIQAIVPKLIKTSSSAGTSGLRGARPGWELSTFVKIKNTGNIVWYDKTSALSGVEYVALSTANPTGRTSLFGQNYEFHNRPTSVLEKVYEADGSTLASNQNTVRPGETAVFRFSMTIPDDISPGLYTEWLGLRFAGSPSVITGADIPIRLKVLELL